MCIFNVHIYIIIMKKAPLTPRSMAFIEQYLPNISDPVYSVHQSFMWFLWLHWRKSTFYPVTAPNDSKCWPIVTSWIQESVASNCDITMTDCSRVVAMDAFLAQWCWGQWFYFVTPVFQHGALFPRGFYGRVLTGFDCVALSRTHGTVPLMNSMHGFGTELIRNLAIWLAGSRDYHLFNLQSLSI